MYNGEAHGSHIISVLTSNGEHAPRGGLKPSWDNGKDKEVAIKLVDVLVAGVEVPEYRAGGSSR